MGYYTTFKLEEVYPAVSRETIISAIQQEYGTSYTTIDIENGDTLKWHQHEADLLAVSTKYPNIAFKICGIGEESDDIWWAEYYQGKVVDYWKKEKLLHISSKTKALINAIQTRRYL